ncbi:MAG TPA: VOC family protein [Bryobacteraceae bacterium]|nr:VOC family protein [Bryobacteraceae bacterium]
MGPLNDAKLVAFLATSDAALAITFYRDVLGLRLLEDSPFALVFDANGVMIRVQKVKEAVVPPYTALGWEVEDIAGTVNRLRGAGVTCERFPGMSQDELGIWQSPSGARVAWFKDPEGLILSVTEF